MLHQRKPWLAASVFLLAALLVSAIPALAGDKKSGDEPKASALFSKDDELTKKDEKDTHPLTSKSPRKVYKQNLTKGKIYQIDLKSADFDAVLRLEDPKGKEVAFNDDAFTPPSLDSRIVYKATEAGEFKIIATCLDRKYGKFTLTVTEVGKLASASLFKSKPMELKLTDGKVGYKGELTKEDAIILNHYFKVFTVQMEAGKSYRIDHKSADFDAFLFLEDPQGNRLKEDDDSGGGTDAKIDHKATASGPHRIIATALLQNQTGKFALEVTETGGEKAKEDEPKKDKDKVKDKGEVKDKDKDKVKDKGEVKDKDKDKKTSLQSFTMFQEGKDILFSKTDGLTDKDERDTKLKTSYRKIYTVKMTEGKVYRIDLSSKDFDSFLRVENAQGKEVAFNDDIDLANKNLDSRVIYVAPKTGDYRLIATTYEPSKTGQFTLEMKYASDAEAAEARLMHRIENYGDLAPAARKKLIAEVTKSFADKGEKLAFKDAQLAAQLSMIVDEDGAESARETCQTLVKLFAAAEDKRVASVAKFIESNMKKLELLGKEIVITGKTVDGKDFDLKKLKGKVVLVDFWATWCGPCIAELPNMESAFKKYHDKGFDIIGISLDRPGDDEKLSKFIENRKMPWQSINIEDSRPLATKYEVNAIPFPVLVDRTGRVVSFRARGPQLERLLERMLTEKK